jgi:hypothetical protein
VLNIQISGNYNNLIDAINIAVLDMLTAVDQAGLQTRSDIEDQFFHDDNNNVDLSYNKPGDFQIQILSSEEIDENSINDCVVRNVKDNLNYISRK